MDKATITTSVNIDIGVDGVKFTFSGIDSDVAELIAAAVDYKALPVTPHSLGTSDVVIESVKQIGFVDRP